MSDAPRAKPAPAPAHSKGSGEFGRAVMRVIGFVLLVVLAVSFVLPFIWQVLMSISTINEVDYLAQLGVPPSAFPYDETTGEHRFTLEQGVNNFRRVFEIVNFGVYFFNSFFVAGWVTLLQVVTSAMAAFAFSRITWPGRDRVFLLYLATMMIPGVVLMVPNFAVVLALGMFNDYTGLIIPAAFSAYGTFLLRQFMLTIPSSLDEAAAIDGAGPVRVFLDVILPLARPGLIVLTIFTFLGNYNSFFWPLILVKDDNLRTLPIGLRAFDSTYGTELPALMAASLMAMIPPIIIFIFLQRYLVKGIQLGAVKG